MVKKQRTRRYFSLQGDVSYFVLLIIGVFAILLVSGGRVISDQYSTFGRLLSGNANNPKDTEQLGTVALVTNTPTPTPTTPPNPTVNPTSGLSPTPAASTTPTTFPFPTQPVIACANSTDIPRYSKFEVSYPYAGNYPNPNNPAVVDLEAVFTAPSGKQLKVPGFYFQDYTRSGDIKKEALNPTGNPMWKIRFGPAEVGKYSYVVTLKDNAGTKTLGNGTFTTCSSTNPGFVHAQGLSLVRENGQPFHMLGVNAPGFEPFANLQGHPWQWGDGTYGVDNLYQQMNTNGLNWYHMWTCQKWTVPNVACFHVGGDLTQMSQPDSWIIDYAINQAEIHDIYTTIVMHWGDAAYDPYDPIKARYFIARYGWSTHLIGLDYQKEISTDPQATSAWSAYVKSVDPYDHIRTTTQWNHYAIRGPGELKTFNDVFSDPNMTMVQSHDYMWDCPGDMGNDTSLYYFSIYADNDPRSSRRFNKPNFDGENGLSPCNDHTDESKPYVLNDHAGIIEKGIAWGTFMSTLNASASWWYYTEPLAGWTQFAPFKALSAYVNALPLVPDSATTFTNYNTTGQVSTSNPNLRVYGRKNATFAMFYIQNTTGTWSALLRDNKTPVPSAGTVTLSGMQAGKQFSVKWFDVDGGTGNVIKTDTVTAAGGNLTITLPQPISQSIAALIQ